MLRTVTNIKSLPLGVACHPWHANRFVASILRDHRSFAIQFHSNSLHGMQRIL